MKKLSGCLLLAGGLLLLGSCRKADLPVSKIQVLQPGPGQGHDTYVEGCIRYQNENFGTQPNLDSQTWTDYEHNSPFDDGRILINFPELNQTPASEIDSVKLTLYKVDNYPYLSGGQYGFNANNLGCIKENWDASTVTWENQPAVDSTLFIVIPQNNDYDSIVVDLTPLIPTEMKYGNGFMIMQQNQVPYSASIYGSSHDSNPSRRPKLTIYYK